MRLVLLYRNRPDIRQSIEQWIIEGFKKGIDFWSAPLHTPFFQTRPVWPNVSELFSFPMWLQCEEVEIQGDRLVTVRTLVIDIVAVSPKPPIRPRRQK